jgi:hypothetical protein
VTIRQGDPKAVRSELIEIKYLSRGIPGGFLFDPAVAKTRTISSRSPFSAIS